MKYENYIGKTYNCLTIQNVYRKGKYVYALCKCSCGNQKEILLDNIVREKQKSCGCLAKYLLKQGLRLKHGLSKHPLHNTWDKIKARCYNSKDGAYIYYGGRGIKMCDEWKNSFKNFYDWAINNGYNKNLSIDRINNNSNYCPDNCRWTTAKEQANNRRSNHLITYKNRTQNILAWSKEKNVPYNTLLARINRYSWTIEKALETPVLES